LLNALSVIKPVEVTSIYSFLQSLFFLVSTVLKGLVSIGLNFHLHLLIVATQYSVVALSQISRTLMHSGANHHCYLATSCQNQYFDQKEKNIQMSQFQKCIQPELLAFLET